MDYGNTKSPSTHHGLGSATLSQPVFLRGKQPIFPMAEILLGQYSCKKWRGKKKKEEEEKKRKPVSLVKNERDRTVRKIR